MPKIFLSYRREDTQYAAGQIASRLQSHFGDEAVIFDVDSLAPGRNFEEQINREVRTSDYFIAVMGRSWLTALDKEGRRRLDDPEDWVRRETELALSLDIPVIPLLLDHISMPSAVELPEGLKGLTLRHAETIHPHPQYFKLDIERLIQKIEQLHKRSLEERRQAEEGRKKQEAEEKKQELARRIQKLADHDRQIDESIYRIREKRARLRLDLEAEERRLRDALKRLKEEHTKSEQELERQEDRLREEARRTQAERAVLESQLARESPDQAPQGAEADSASSAPDGVKQESHERNPAEQERRAAAAQAEEQRRNARRTERAPSFTDARAGQVRDDNALEMPFVWIPPGEFTMGSSNHEEGRDKDEEQVQVKLTKGFWLGQHEVTQAEWQRLMLTMPWTPWSGKGYVKEGRNYPATYVSWDDAKKFCDELTVTERTARRIPPEWHYTLPSEAQWEYACRAGTTSRFSFGDDESDLGDYAWFTKNAEAVGAKYAQPVAQKRPNPFGLYDMHGNVWEWCSDNYAAKLAGGTDPEGPLKGSNLVLRGGGWMSTASVCRSARRFKGLQKSRLNYVGFRVAAVPLGN